MSQQPGLQPQINIFHPPTRHRDILPPEFFIQRLADGKCAANQGGRFIQPPMIQGRSPQLVGRFPGALKRLQVDSVSLPNLLATVLPALGIESGDSGDDNPLPINFLDPLDQLPDGAPFRLGVGIQKQQDVSSRRSRPGILRSARPLSGRQRHQTKPGILPLCRCDTAIG